MVATWFKQRRVYRDRVSAEVVRLQAEYGHAAYVMAATAARSPLGDWRFAEAVRDELGRRTGNRPPSDGSRQVVARAI